MQTDRVDSEGTDDLGVMGLDIGHLSVNLGKVMAKMVARIIQEISETLEVRIAMERIIRTVVVVTSLVEVIKYQLLTNPEGTM